MFHATDTRRWDCSSPGHERCVTLAQAFECGLPGTALRFYVSTRADLEAVILAIKAEHPKFEDMALCLAMGVCPNGLFDDFTLEAFRLCASIKSGDPWPWPGHFYDQPAIFVQARTIIQSEEAQIEREDQLNARIQ